MTNWDTTVVDATECPECGADLTPYREGIRDLGWRDDEERENGTRAFAMVAHMHDKHRVLPQVGDLVTYTSAWRGLMLTSEVYRVTAVYENYDEAGYARSMGADVEPRYVTRYGLGGLTRRDQGCTPSTGAKDHQVIFTIVKDAPPVEGDLFDSLDWDGDEEDYS